MEMKQFIIHGRGPSITSARKPSIIPQPRIHYSIPVLSLCKAAKL